jgi:hypothetical protein
MINGYGFVNKDLENVDQGAGNVNVIGSLADVL